MSLNPKTGTLEEIVLDKLLEKGTEGITILDFPEHLNITSGVIDHIIGKIRSGTFETEQSESTDNLIKH